MSAVNNDQETTIIPNRYLDNTQMVDGARYTTEEDPNELKNTDILASISYAKRIQLAILPSDEKLKTHLPDSFVLYKLKSISRVKLNENVILG